ncbi:MAG TPA: hypothetical protein VIM99_04390, partial [Blastocatellia bacterium]
VIGAIASRKQAEWRGVLKTGLIVIGAGALWRLTTMRFSAMSSNVTPFASAVFVLPAAIGFIIRDYRKESRRILLVIAVFGFVAILRVILNVATTGPYAPFYLPASIIVYLYLLFRVAPDLLARNDSARANIRRAAMLMVALMIIGIGANSAIRLRRDNTFTVSSARGSFITVPEIGEPLQAAIRYAEQRTGPDDYLLAAPQATTINFLAARRYPLNEEIIHPGFLAGEKESAAIERIKARKTPLILIVNMDTSEFGDRAFGIDYNAALMRWIAENYRLAARFDSAVSRNAKLGDKPFFILAYEMK